MARSRSRGKDVKEVWSRWEYKVSKVKLADALLPTLLRKIQLCMTTKRSHPSASAADQRTKLQAE